MTARRSRHDHFPRADAARIAAMNAAAAKLAAHWQADDACPGALAAAIDALADARPDEAVAALAPRLADRGWLGDRVAAALALLAAEPFARPPLRLVGDGEGAGGFVLFERGMFRLSLQLHRVEQTAEAPATALFVPGAAAIHILASGGAQLHRHRVAVRAAEAAGQFSAARAARCHSRAPRPLVTGETLLIDTARQAIGFSGARGDIILLELAARPPSPLPVRGYDIASGALLHVASARRDDSFRAMALALLRMMHRTDAAPLFAEAARSGDFAARWSAMREYVALDPAAARSPLAAMARADPHPEVRAAAAATLALYRQPAVPGQRL